MYNAPAVPTRDQKINLRRNGKSLGELYQMFGEMMRTQFSKYVWVNALFHDPNLPDSIIITDERHPEEYLTVKQLGGINIRVNGDPTDARSNGKDPRDPNHISETALDNYNFDYVIENNGTIAQLDEKVIQILFSIMFIDRK